MRFRSYDSLKTFDAVARTLSMTKAADEMHQSKGSISYQVGKLEIGVISGNSRCPILLRLLTTSFSL